MNTIELVKEIFYKLKNAGIHTAVFGGWAKELNKEEFPRQHKDIDFLCITSFSIVDEFIKNDSGVVEIKEKHFKHKRAFLYKGVMVELFRVEKIGDKYITTISGYIIEWPTVNSSIGRIINDIFVSYPEVTARYDHYYQSL
jgi:hypothetical protein